MMADLSPLWLTVQLAGTTTFFLLLVGTPLAWWLANTRSKIRPAIEALTALPIVLPPTVIGFYFLILLSPTSTIGRFWVDITGETFFSQRQSCSLVHYHQTHLALVQGESDLNNL